MKRTVSGVAEVEAEGVELNEKMLEWQKSYQEISEKAAKDEKPDAVTDLSFSDDVEHLADILMPGDKKMSYGEFLERKLDARDTLKPIRGRRKSRHPSPTTQVGRFC